MNIAVFSDVICPWCFIGKRRLERALDELGLRATTEIEWLPFELNPDMPADGTPRALYRAQKFGADRSAILDAEMAARGHEDGIAFAFDRIDRTPNTRNAHLLVAYATRQGRGDAMKELMHAYFETGRDVGRESVLLEIAAELGFPGDGARAALADSKLRQEVVAIESKAHELGISGVPFFIVDRQWTVSGAQTSEHWVAALRARRLAETSNAA